MAKWAGTIEKLPQGTKLYFKFRLAKPLVIRVWIAMILIRMAARILDCDFEIDNG